MSRTPRPPGELVRAAHQNAKDALAELRELARGIHPPVLDNGLPDALATLAAVNAIPAELEQRVAVVDGRLGIVSPPGGPTRIAVELPLRA
jgi:signal transduction histidine kinase